MDMGRILCIAQKQRGFMIALVILFAILVTFFLNFAFAKKIQNKTYRFFMDAANVLLALIFVILFVVTGTVQKNMNSFIDYEISQLEKNANEIYPGALDAQMNTAELKDLLEKSRTPPAALTPLRKTS